MRNPADQNSGLATLSAPMSTWDGKLLDGLLSSLNHLSLSCLLMLHLPAGLFGFR